MFSIQKNCVFLPLILDTYPIRFKKSFKTMKYKALIVFWSCIFCLAANNCCVSSGKNGMAKELKSIEKDIPLPYHEALDKTMKELANKSLPKTFKNHEAFVDSALVQRSIPLELRYLPYALSGMKADYRSGDRCGYWALPSLVAMHYGLNINESCDERLSVEAATVAALDYLNDLYKKYDDWWYSILAYANSPTSLSHALIHHGSEPELWDIYELQLMPNTSVISDFIACVYLGNEGRLKFGTNASQKVKATEPKHTEVVEPVETPTTKVVEPVETPTAKENVPNTKTNSSTLPQAQSSGAKTKEYKIKKGDTLWGIAAKHHVSVEDLMKWNHLKDDKIREGQTLIIKK